LGFINWFKRAIIILKKGIDIRILGSVKFLVVSDCVSSNDKDGHNRSLIIRK